MKFHDHKWITESVIVRKPFSNSVTDRQTECKPIVPSGFTGGGLIMNPLVMQLFKHSGSIPRNVCVSPAKHSYV